MLQSRVELRVGCTSHPAATNIKIYIKDYGDIDQFKKKIKWAEPPQCRIHRIVQTTSPALALTAHACNLFNINYIVNNVLKDIDEREPIVVEPRIQLHLDGLDKQTTTITARMSISHPK
jgi:hypothetical protein